VENTHSKPVRTKKIQSASTVKKAQHKRYGRNTRKKATKIIQIASKEDIWYAATVKKQKVLAAKPTTTFTTNVKVQIVLPNPRHAVCLNPDGHDG